MEQIIRMHCQKTKSIARALKTHQSFYRYREQMMRSCPCRGDSPLHSIASGNRQPAVDGQECKCLEGPNLFFFPRF